jgi:hypothetical protein
MIRESKRLQMKATALIKKSMGKKKYRKMFPRQFVAGRGLVDISSVL